MANKRVRILGIPGVAGLLLTACAGEPEEISTPEGGGAGDAECSAPRSEERETELISQAGQVEEGAERTGVSMVPYAETRWAGGAHQLVSSDTEAEFAEDAAVLVVEGEIDASSLDVYLYVGEGHMSARGGECSERQLQATGHQTEWTDGTGNTFFKIEDMDYQGLLDSDYDADEQVSIVVEDPGESGRWVAVRAYWPRYFAGIGRDGFILENTRNAGGAHPCDLDEDYCQTDRH